MSSGRSSCCVYYFKVLLGALVVGLLLWLLMVGMPENGEAARTTRLAAPIVPAVAAREQRDDRPNNPDLDLDFMSKVKVPKGPDPIHNRKRGTNGRPPSQA